MEEIMAQNPMITIEMEHGGSIKAELYPETAPNTVRNFISLAGKGYYDGLCFHRVIPGFMIQGGCPEGTGTGGPGYCIRGEFSQNGFQNSLKHSAGVLSMARTMAPDSAGSQFFIMHQDSPHLDGAYAAFGKVTEGMEVVDRIAQVPTDYSDRPMEVQVMKKSQKPCNPQASDRPQAHPGQTAKGWHVKGFPPAPWDCRTAYPICIRG